ncbi:hypothetical protein BLNAU_17004 [Blattamonas nauphoetae]|uniref:Protein kinase domain-containing protein n=1 Tax=Blattamonas nauphoetae TaxID=2049346 RepID=A0ABQ9XBM2_9EUKA|nr:hypothetical protein BLNAU_17004 [Blattamonas nauphoetae]
MLDPTSLYSLNMHVVGADQRNTLTFVRERPTDFLFCIENTTVSLESLSFNGRNGRICQGTTDTFCSLSNCVVDDCGHHSVLESDGWLSAIWSKFTLSIGMTSHGLVDSPSETCHFVLSGSILQDWRTTEETSLTGTAFDQLDVSFCRFSNVSQTHSVLLQPLHQTFQTTSIVGCDLNDVENDLYGSISRDMNNHNLVHASNTTFSHSFHSEFNAYTTTFTSTQNTSVTLRTSFSDCLFHGCKSTTHGAGIYHFSSSSLTVSNCKFDGCRAEPSQTLSTTGGGICFYSTSASAVTVNISDATFVSCYAHSGGGVSIRHNTGIPNIKAELKNCRFESLSAVYQCAGFILAYVDGPSITDTVCQDSSNPTFEAGGRVANAAGKLTMDSVSFINLRANGNAAFALDVHSGTAAFSNLRVAGCTTVENSPFVVGSNIDRTESDTFKFENCLFEHNYRTSGQGSSANDIALYGAALYASKETFKNCWTASGQPSVYAKQKNHDDWIVTNEVIQVANATGVDKLFCWAPGSQCKTMTDVIGNRLGPWYVGKIAMGDGEYHERKLEMKNQSLVVEGSEKTKTTMIDGGSSETLFTITTGTLTASAIRFVPSASSHLITLSDEGTISVSDSSVQTLETNMKLSKSVFSVSAGTLSLTRVDCSSLSFTATTVLFLFSSSAHSLTLTNSSFTSVSSGGSGSCISATITTGQSVKIGEEGGSDTFSSCSSDGDGGALNVKLVDTGSLSIVSTRFSKCSSNGVGGGLLIELGSTTGQTEWTLNLSGASFGRDAEKNMATHGPNLFLTGKFFETAVTPSTFPAVTGAEEGDMWGEDSNSTVSSSLLVYLAPFSNKMIVGGSTAFDIDHCGHFGVGCVSIQNALNHVKTSKSDTLIISFESGATLSESFSFETTQTVSFVSSPESPQTVQVLGSGRLTVSLGKLSLTKLSFSTTVASFSSSLITLNGGSLDVTKCIFTGFRSSVSGGIVSAALSSSSSLIVSGSSFVSCSSSLNGGGIAVECAENTPSSSLVIEASFDSCSCGVGKKGDWVFVSGRELSKLIVHSNWETTPNDLSQPSDSSKLWGVDSLPCGSSLSSSTLLVYLIGHSSSSLFTSSSTGSEVIGCGESSTPCRALSTSFNHLSSAGSNTLSVIDSSTLDFVLTSSFPSLTLTGTSSPSKSLSVTSSGRFSVHSNKLSLTHLNLSPSSSSFSSSLITVSSTGSLSLDSCTISGFSSSSSPKVLTGSIGTGQTLSIFDTLFDSCSATSGAGIVELEVVEDGEVKIEGSSRFEKCSLSENGHLVQIVCSDLVSFVGTNPLPALKPSKPTDRIFTPDEKEMFWGKESNGVDCSLLFIWFAHTQGDLHVHSAGEDDIRCGDSILPCLSLSHSMGQKKNGFVVIDSPMTLSTMLTSSASKWTLKGDLLNALTISETGGIAVNESEADLTLSSLKFVTGSVGLRTSAMLVVSDGRLTLSSCSFGDGVSDLRLPVCSVEGGVVEISSSLAVNRPSPSLELFSVCGGRLLAENGLSLTHGPTTRTSSLFSLSGGETRLRNVISSLSSSFTPISLSLSALLVISGSTSLFSSEMANLIVMDGGRVEIETSTLTFAEPCGLIVGSGSVVIVSSTLKREEVVIASNSARGSVTMTLRTDDRLEIGKEDENVRFEGWMNEGNGGALAVTISGGSLSIIHSTFVSCRSSLNGGGIAVECAENTPSSSLVIEASFDSCSCGVGQKGDWVFVSGRELSKLIVHSNWETSTAGLSQPSDSSKLWGEDSYPCGSSLSSSTLLVYLIGHSSSSLFTSSSTGSEVIGCGESSTPCKTLSTSFNHLSSAGSNTLSVIDSSTLDFVLKPSFPSLTLTGTSSLSKPLSVTSSGRFSVPSNTLSITHLCLSPSFAPFSSSLITISGPGIVSVTSCSFSSFTLSNTPLIDHQNGELKLKSSSFSSIHRSEGNGSCLHSAMEEDMKLEVDDVWMDDVSVFYGNGDGFFISFPSSLSSNVASFSLTNLHFASSPSKNYDSPKSHFLFLTGFNLSSWIEAGDSRFAGSFEGEDVNAEWLWTEDEHAEIELSASLLFYLTEHVGPVGVDSSGLDIAKCGYHTVWCPTLPSALAKLPSSQSSTVVVQLSVVINTSIAFTSSTILTGLTGSSQLVVGENAQFEVQTDNVNLELSSLVVSLPSELSSSCLFLSSKGSLSIEAVSFVFSDPANVFSSQLIHSTAPLSLTDVNVTSVSLSGVGLIESWSDVSVSGCHFKSISRSTGLGSVIEANITETTKMKVIDSSFDDCACDSTTNWILLKGVNSETNDLFSWQDTFSLTSPRSGVLVILDEHEPFSLVYELYPPGASLVVSSSSGIDHRLCGNESVPCRTISGSDCASGGRSFSVRGSCLMGGELWIETEGLWIKGLNSNVGTVLMDGTSRIVQKVGDYPKPVTLRHVCVDVSSSTLNSESSIIHLETGTLDMSSCSFKSSQTIGMKLLSMASGILKFNSISLSSLSFSTTPIVLTSLTEATLEHVTISDCVTSHIISASSIPSLTLQTIVIERVMTSLLNIDHSDASKIEELCHWTGGVVSLEHCSTVVRVSQFADLEEGAFSVNGGSLELHLSSFEETLDESTFFPSAHRNIACQNEGSVSINSPNGGDGSSILPSLWIDSSNCTLTKNSQPITAPLFIPTLDTTKSTSKTSKKMITITLVGTLLMPCGLHLEVFSVEPNKAETGDVQSLDLSSIGIDCTETSVTVELNETADFPNLKREHEWHARLAFGLGTDRTASFRVKLSLSDERKAQAKAAMKWVIPLIAGIAALLVLVLILLLVLRKRKKDKEQKKTKLSEMGEVDQAMDDIAKMDDPSLAMTDNLHHFSYDTPTETNKTCEPAHDTQLPIPPDEPPDGLNGQEEKTTTTVIARGPDGKEVHIPLTKDTLYNRLHGPNPELQLNSAQMRVQLVAALTAVHKHSATAQVLTRLNPHVVFFDSAGVVCLQVNQHPHPQCSDGEKQMKREEEFDRWKAPEVANGEVKVDHQQAAVFSLGLLFWEMETGMVPFRELDAVNAQRQLGTGVRPPMDRIKSDSLVELIEQCLDLEPENRPAFSELEKMLSPPSLHQPSQPLSRRPVPLVNKTTFS